jgi:hypothetical protein
MLVRRGITVSSCALLEMMERLPVLVRLASLLIQMDPLAMVRIHYYYMYNIDNFFLYNIQLLQTLMSVQLIKEVVLNYVRILLGHSDAPVQLQALSLMLTR